MDCLHDLDKLSRDSSEKLLVILQNVFVVQPTPLDSLSKQKDEARWVMTVTMENIVTFK